MINFDTFSNERYLYQILFRVMQHLSCLIQEHLHRQIAQKSIVLDAR